MQEGLGVWARKWHVLTRIGAMTTQGTQVRFESDGQLEQLRDLLRRVSFDEVSLQQCCGVTDLRRVAPEDRGNVLHRLDDGGALGTVARVMLFGLPTARSRLADAIAPMTPTDWETAGLIARRGDEVTAQASLFPIEDLVLLTDRPVVRNEPHATDHVMAVGGGTKLLLAAMIRRPCGRLVDLGTGCGVFALAGARFSHRSLGVDLNERAVHYARINARLNDIATATFQASDFHGLLETADGPGSFDRVIAQPAFVIVPERRYLYRDAAGRGDESIRRVVELAMSLLAEGGCAQLVVNWIHPKGQNADQRLASWFDGHDCDAWVLRSRQDDARDYAARWIQTPATTSSRRALETELDRWAAFYDSQGIEAVSSGVMTLRKRSGAPNWFHVAAAPEHIIGFASDHVLRVIEGLDFLEGRSDEDLLAASLRVPPDLRQDQRWQPTAGGWQLEQCSSRLIDGLAYEIHHDAPIAELLRGCNGETPFGDIVTSLPSEPGATPGDIRQRCVSIARMLLSHGVLLPPG